MTLVEIRDLHKSYRAPDGSVQPVLDVPRFDIAERQQVALEGRSGSGKTTLLNIVAGILRPDAGRVRVCGSNLTDLSEAARDRIRAENIGYVFQTFHLLPAYTALENVLLGMTFGPGPDRRFATELLETLGLGDRLAHRPGQLSIGQQQRVALARALANRPRLVLADEPTGNLDPTRAAEAIELIQAQCVERGAALLVVSHDHAILERFETRHSLTELNRAARGATQGAGA